MVRRTGTRTRVDWLDEGAIQLVLPERLIGLWHGSLSSDYERACAASDDWLNQLRVGDGLALVLGGDPSMLVVVPGDAGTVVIVRWVFGDDEDELLAFALRGGGVQRTEPDLVFENTESAWRVFDAAADPSADVSSWRAVPLPVGRVRVQTSYQESEGNAAIVHRFGGAP